MLKLAVLIFILTAPTFAGGLVIAVLALDSALASAGPLLAAAGVGVVLSLPASWFIAKQILDAGRPKQA